MELWQKRKKSGKCSDSATAKHRASQKKSKNIYIEKVEEERKL